MVANIGLVLRCACICQFILLLSSRQTDMLIAAYLIESSLILILYVVLLHTMSLTLSVFSILCLKVTLNHDEDSKILAASVFY
jgi:hypothetical protein